MKFFSIRFAITLCVCTCLAANAIGQVSPLDAKHLVSTRKPMVGAIVAVDTLILGGTVVTMDGERRVIENGGIAIRGDKVVAVGTRAEISLRHRARHIINATGKVIIPGLINTHTRPDGAVSRDLDDLDLQEWLTKYIFPAEAKNVDPRAFCRASGPALVLRK
jgi:5-methylthioadenosine/S-adenosylhomocysteine deaminase